MADSDEAKVFQEIDQLKRELLGFRERTSKNSECIQNLKEILSFKLEKCESTKKEEIDRLKVDLDAFKDENISLKKKLNESNETIENLRAELESKKELEKCMVKYKSDQEISEPFFMLKSENFNLNLRIIELEGKQRIDAEKFAHEIKILQLEKERLEKKLINLQKDSEQDQVRLSNQIKLLPNFLQSKEKFLTSSIYSYQDEMRIISFGFKRLVESFIFNNYQNDPTVALYINQSEIFATEFIDQLNNLQLASKFEDYFCDKIGLLKEELSLLLNIYQRFLASNRYKKIENSLLPQCYQINELIQKLRFDLEHFRALDKPAKLLLFAFDEIKQFHKL